MRLLKQDGGVVVEGSSINYDDQRRGWMVDDHLYLDLDREYVLEEIPEEARYMLALEAMYDAKAKEKSFDTRYTLAVRAGYPGPFQATAAAFGAWMDTCNLTARGVLARVLAGEIEKPTIPELLEMMPPMEWPE